MSARKRDLIISALLLGLCGFWAVETGKIRNTTIPGTPGPRYFPYIIIVALAALSIGLALTSLLAKDTTKAAVKAADGDDCAEPEAVRVPPLRTAYAFASLAAYALATQFLGFFTATALVCLFILKVFMRTRDWKMVLLGTLTITGGIFVVFKLIINISLPSGILY